MINEQSLAYGKKSSIIREIFEYGKRRKAEIGSDKVFDFSLGNPSVPCPSVVTDALKELIEGTPAQILHGYTSAVGDNEARAAIVEYLNKEYSTCERAENVYITVGAAASLTSTLNAILNEGDEVIVLAPFFPEYRVFVEKAGGKIVPVKSLPDSLLPDLDGIEGAITARTKAIIINSPNNPSGVIIDENILTRLAEILNRKSSELGADIFLISDEPYRELVYGEKKVPFVTKYYDNSIVCYSFSKSLSLPGERIGYVLVGSKCKNDRDVFYAICGSARSLGYVCAPSLFQYIIPRVIGRTSDLSAYKRNRDTLYNALSEFGYSCVHPDGAFYLFVKALESDAKSFCERAKKYELLLVPSDDFGYEGYVRISYCVSYDTIVNSLEAFKKLYKEYEEK
ncbi:MAG: pyridoxal phosphate-dependent aminotransferase [Clostridia bacterium]|nr:pyridoxal phosphate-dependent aminotransferase [Clostridia bacterium]